jgi:hypothetical protein
MADHPVASPIAFAPEGWPVVDRGILMEYVGRVLIVRIEQGVSDRAVDRFMTEWTRGIDIRGPNARAAALYDIPNWSDANAVRRMRFAHLLKSRQEMLRQTTKAWALCTTSRLVSGMVQAIYWMTPPPYPHTVVSTVREGFDFIQRHIPEVDAARYTASYARLLERYGETIRGR